MSLLHLLKISSLFSASLLAHSWRSHSSCFYIFFLSFVIFPLEFAYLPFPYFPSLLQSTPLSFYVLSSTCLASAILHESSVSSLSSSILQQIFLENWQPSLSLFFPTSCYTPSSSWTTYSPYSGDQFHHVTSSYLYPLNPYLWISWFSLSPCTTRSTASSSDLTLSSRLYLCRRLPFPYWPACYSLRWPSYLVTYYIISTFNCSFIALFLYFSCFSWSSFGCSCGLLLYISI